MALISHQIILSCNVVPNITVKPVRKSGRPPLLTEINSKKDLTVIEATYFTKSRQKHLLMAFCRKNVEIIANSSLIYSNDILIFLYFPITFLASSKTESKLSHTYEKHVLFPVNWTTYLLETLRGDLHGLYFLFEGKMKESFL